MVVKDKIGRRRYIAFEIITKRRVEKREIVRLLNNINSKLELRKREACDEDKTPKVNTPTSGQRQAKPYNFNYDTVRLIKFDGTRGLIYCKHYNKDVTIESLTGDQKRIDGAILRLLGVSGTIRNATKKYLDKLNDYT